MKSAYSLGKNRFLNKNTSSLIFLLKTVVSAFFVIRTLFKQQINLVKNKALCFYKNNINKKKKITSI